MTHDAPSPEANYTRPPIDVSEPTERPWQVNDTLSALVQLNEHHNPDPAVYLHGNRLARVVRGDGRPGVEQFPLAALTETLDHAAKFHKGLKAKNGEPVEDWIPAPQWIAQRLLARTPSDLRGLPRIERVVDVPVFGPDEGPETKLHTTPGYNAATRCYLEPATEIKGWLSSFEPDDFTLSDNAYERSFEDCVNHETAREALATLMHPFEEFPFADDASRAHFLAMVLEPFVRVLLGDAPTPAYVVMATTPGTGKTLLVRNGLYIGCGAVPTSTYVTDENEFDKRILAYLMTGTPALWLDNIADPVNSPSLANALTSTLYRGRIIQQSSAPEIPIRCTWVMTGNNPTFSQEIVRRTVPIILDCDRPLNRSFKIHDLDRYVREHRGELVGAAITLVMYWLQGGGAPDYADDEGRFYRGRSRGAWLLATYERWSTVLGGILHAVGVHGFGENIDEWIDQTTPDTADLVAFLADWHERNTGPITVSELVKITENGTPGNTDAIDVPASLMQGHKDVKAGLTYNLLRRHNGSVIGDYRITNTIARSKTSKWQVDKVAIE